MTTLPAIPDLAIALDALDRITARVDAGEPLVRLGAREVRAINTAMVAVLTEVEALRAQAAPAGLHLEVSNGPHLRVVK